MGLPAEQANATLRTAIGRRLGGGVPGSADYPRRRRGRPLMYELRVVALSEDARYVVLAPVLEGRRERYRVPVDERLRAALRGELGRLERKIRPDSALTPREIQTRVRSGETAETIAAAAGVPVEWVLRFETPVLAERGMVARQARHSSLSVSGGEWTGVPLEEIVTARMEADGTKPDLAEWDAWRRDDSRWVLQLRIGATTAHWLWDPALQRLVVHDDAARSLLHNGTPALPDAEPLAELRHLVLAPEPADELLPEVLLELRSEAGGSLNPPEVLDLAGGSDPSEATEGADPTTAAGAVETREPEDPDVEADRDPELVAAPPAGNEAEPAVGRNSADEAPAELPPDLAQDPMPPAEAGLGEPDSSALALALGAPELSRYSLGSPPSRGDGSDPDPTEGGGTSEEPGEGSSPPARASKKARRKTVPSWEDILLGTGTGTGPGAGDAGSSGSAR